MSETAVGLAVGLLTGLLSSLATWWFLTHGIQPRIAVSTQIANPGPNDFRFKFANIGRRPLYDVSWTISVRIENLVPHARSDVIRLRRGQHALIHTAKNSDVEWWHRIRAEEVSRDKLATYGSLLPDDIGEGLADGTLADLSRLFELGPPGSVLIEVLVSATDGFFGSRTVVERIFTSHDVVRGSFVAGGVEVLPGAPEDGETGETAR